MTTLSARLPSKEERQNAIDLERLAKHLSACHNDGYAHELETAHDFLEALEDFQSSYDETITLRRGEN